MSTPPFHGSCLCGKITFEVNASPMIVSCCHCTNCKKYTGTVFTSNVIFPANSVKITKGEELVKSYRDDAQDSGNSIARVFCSDCSAPLYVTGCEFKTAESVFYSALDDFNVPGEAEKQPQIEFYSKDRTSWVRPLDGALQPETKPGRGEGDAKLDLSALVKEISSS
ncbi:hypothetical protein SCHPADRAFT_901064 [Schizopora paradoxa]|uniref:CENP-V/GFA domain-containing protein n=1 Tax=Schizopora paradoxa TaxID=27342 RepID=A0A0H2RYW6_9AGAM|nr:hypothetical protein SCHPADRAFT_901064 [Schizopora paradoxa]